MSAEGTRAWFVQLSVRNQVTADQMRGVNGFTEAACYFPGLFEYLGIQPNERAQFLDFYMENILGEPPSKANEKVIELCKKLEEHHE